MTPELLRVRKLGRGAEPIVEKGPEFKVDIRMEGIAQDVILVVVEKLRNGSRTKSVLEDLGKTENSMIFSEKSSRTIHQLGNIELHELGQMSRTVQCHFCLMHIPEGLTLLLLWRLSST